MIRTIAIVIGLGAILLLGQPIYWKLIANVRPLHGSTMNMAKKQLEKPSDR